MNKKDRSESEPTTPRPEHLEGIADLRDEAKRRKSTRKELESTIKSERSKRNPHPPSATE